MQGNAERCAAPDGGEGIRVSDRPADIGTRFNPVTGAGCQRAQLLEDQACGNRRGERVGSGAKGKFALPRVPGGAARSGEHAHAGQQRVMHHPQTEQPCGMAAKGTPVGRDQKQSRGDERGKQAQDAEIPDFGGVDADEVGSALRQDKREEHSERGDRAVGRDHKRSDMEENWMHLGQDTGLDPREEALRLGTREVESDPLGRG